MSEYLIDLAARRFGGEVVESSDEHFGMAARLVANSEPKSGGERVDAWETARRRRSGHEWAIIRLGLPGMVRRIVLDTTHITGSHPAEVSVEAIHMPGDPNLVDLIRQPERWRHIVSRTAIGPSTTESFTIGWAEPATHIRLILYPDGAVARLRVMGEPSASGRATEQGTDLAAVVNGGLAIDCSDAHFAGPNTMLLEDKQRQGDGWLTRRRRDGRSDWAVVRLAAPAEIERAVVDTRGFKGNAPEAVSIEGVSAPGASADALRAASWETLVDRTNVESDKRREFTELSSSGPFSHLRLTIHPDGGINRFQVFGNPSGVP